MRCIRFIFLLTILLFREEALAQCGLIQPRIAVFPDSANGQLSVGRLSPVNSVLATDWVIDSVHWQVNGQIIIADTALKLDTVFPPGLVYVFMTIYSRDTVSGTVCEGSASNYFLTVSSDLYPAMDVSGNGLTKTFSARIFGVDSCSSPVWNFADGNFGSGLNVTHTYQTPGIYSVSFSPGNGALGNITRKVHVNDGFDDMQGAQLNSPAMFCDSFSLSMNTTPSYANGVWQDIFTYSYYDFGPVIQSSNASQLLSGGVPFTGKFLVPGQCYIYAVLNDGNGGTHHEITPVFVSDSCMAALDTVNGKFWNDADADGIKDAKEGMLSSPLYQVDVFGNRQSITQKGRYRIPVPPFASKLQGVIPFTDNFTTRTKYSVNFNNSANHDGYDFGVAVNSSLVKGKVFADLDGDSLYNQNTDKFLNHVTIQLHNLSNGNMYYTTTDINGDYETIVPIGLYNISPVYIPMNAPAVYPDTIKINLLNSSGNLPSFICHPTIAGSDLTVKILPEEVPVVGEEYTIKLKVQNLGADQSKGQFVLTYDTSLQVTAVSPSNGFVDAANHTVTWYSQTIPSLTDTLYQVQFNLSAVNPPSQLNQYVALFIAPGFTDIDLTNNADVCTTSVKNQLLLNGKLVTPEGSGPTGLVSSNDRLYYRINFMNTGVSSQQDIIVQDMLNNLIDISSLRVEGSSHPVRLLTRGNNLVFTFRDIQLPDSATNNPASKGYIEFSVKPASTAVAGSILTNSADLFFDSLMISTNSVLNTIQGSPSGINELFESVEISPNPFSACCAIKLQGLDLVKSAHLYSLEGKEIPVEMNWNTQQTFEVCLRNQSPGIYLLELNGRFYKLCKQ